MVCSCRTALNDLGCRGAKPTTPAQEPNRWWPGGAAVLTTNVLVSSFSLPQCAECFDWYRAWVVQVQRCLGVARNSYDAEAQVVQSSEVMKRQVHTWPLCLRLRAFGDGLVLVVRLRIIILYLACAEYEKFNFVSASQVRWMHSFFGPEGQI